MVFTEVKKRNNHIYYYRVISVRKGLSVVKNRIYLGSNLSVASLATKEKEADAKLVKNRELDLILPKIKGVLIKYNVKQAGIFGSFAKGKQRKDSDIDILIQPPAKIGFGFSGIQADLEKSLKKKVDLVSYNGLSPYLKKEILENEIRII
ncbi:nucleotidyltransferase family protein [Candidatus Woesearchaeota archaeon]|nr:nucleotidyltransferase family protein [Candidatus Woesearchaeota archaeon]